MKQKFIFIYLLNGFSLANRSLDIFFAILFLTLFSSLGKYTQISPLVKIFPILSFIVFFVGIGFSLSLPVFLVQKQQKKALDYKNVLTVSFKNARRLIFPGILFLIIFIPFLIFSVIFISVFLHVSLNPTFIKDITTGIHPIQIALITLFSFLGFTSFFFSLEGDGIFISAKKSMIVAFKNLPYVGTMVLISIISYTVASYVPISNPWGLLRVVLNAYVGLVLAASALFYYQAVIIKGSLNTPQKRKYSFGIIFVIALLFLIGVVYLNSYSKKDKMLPNVSLEQQGQNRRWSNYKGGSHIGNYDFSFTFPQGWKVNTREEGKLYDNVGYRINFDLSPQNWTLDNSENGWFGWGIMSVDVYPSKPDISQWLSAFLPDYKDYLVYNVEQIGNKRSYSLYPRPDAPYHKREFSRRSVVLGDKYSYVISFGSGGAGDINLMKKEIFPLFKFE